MNKSTTTFETLLAERDLLDKKSSQLTKDLRALDKELGKPDGAFPSQSIQNDPTRLAMKNQSAKVSARIKAINAILVKSFPKELAQTRKYR